MFIKSTNSKYKSKSQSQTNGEQILISFFKDNKRSNYDNVVFLNTSETETSLPKKTIEKSVYYIRSTDKLFLEHYYYNKNRNKVNKGDEIKSSIIYY